MAYGEGYDQAFKRLSGQKNEVPCNELLYQHFLVCEEESKDSMDHYVDMWINCPKSLIIKNTNYRHHSDIYDDIYDISKGTSYLFKGVGAF